MKRDKKRLRVSERLFIACMVVFSLLSCRQDLPEAGSTGGAPRLFPDYANVTIPANIAPLNFRISESVPAIALFDFQHTALRVNASRGTFNIPPKAWKRLLQQAAGDSIRITLYEQTESGWHRYDPFFFHVAKEPVDPYLVYRRIAPGYRMWNEMGIYQRNLESFNEETLLTNKLMHNNCMNCHSFRMQSPDTMLFHLRSGHAGTYLAHNGRVRPLQPGAKQPSPPLVYPYWHPSGKFIAFSSNDTKQDFHLSSPNRVEVFDLSSDIYIYDLEKETFLTEERLSSAARMETFPAFSPDGRQLYFCSSPALPMPESYQEVKYDLLSIPFDPQTKTFGTNMDTLYHAATEGRSAKFPRVSPDGEYLLFTVSDYGNFSIWHKDSDLRLLHTKTGETDSLPLVNSQEVESYHSWSSNSRWFVFSSRRLDGLYTRPYICYIHEDGSTGKPFLLPQKDTDYYTRSLFSFNIPELVKGKVRKPFSLSQ